jgi:hypothetical protein
MHGFVMFARLPVKGHFLAIAEGEVLNGGIRQIDPVLSNSLCEWRRSCAGFDEGSRYLDNFAWGNIDDCSIGIMTKRSDNDRIDPHRETDSGNLTGLQVEHSW